MAVGAIIGAPFLLATLAMMLVGLFAILYKNRREQGTGLNVHVETLERDLIFFLVFFGLGCGLGAFDIPSGLRVAIAVGFLLAYAGYALKTVRGGGETQDQDTIADLVFARPPASVDAADPPMGWIIAQFVVALGTIVGGAHLFVEELIHVADSLGVDAIVLSLVLAPLATELPEKANSFFWMRDGKDSLALGNITGAMVFQSTIPIAFGLAFTEWDLDKFGLLSAALGLAGGILAYWVLRLRGRFTVPAVAAWGVLYGSFLVFVIVQG